jgi:N-acetylglucosamine-6-sulfatase
VWICLLSALALLWASLACDAEVADISSGGPANVILILTDDQPYTMLGFLGHPFLETPHLDALAGEGVHFSNAFVTTALCSPSRASILTGQYAHRHGVHWNDQSLKGDALTFPQSLKQAGYETAFIGKWNLGAVHPRPSFDHWVTFPGQGRYFPEKGHDLVVDDGQMPQKTYLTDELTDYAMAWLNRRSGAEPFFLLLAHKGVHSPYQPAPRHLGRYARAKFPAPPTLSPRASDHPGKPRWLLRRLRTRWSAESPYGTDLRLLDLYRRQCEMLLAVDESLGRILEWLERKGRDRDTLVIFMGDNGFHWGEHGMIEKMTAYEASIRVPLIARFPARFPAGGVVEAMVANIDVAPTILEAAGLRAPATMDGRSFFSLAAGKHYGASWREHLFYEFGGNAWFRIPAIFALRGERYKYIRSAGEGMAELYDLEADPAEAVNLVSDPHHAKTVRRMEAMLQQRLARIRTLPRASDAEGGGARNGADTRRGAPSDLEERERPEPP